MEVLLEVAEIKVTLITTVISLQSGPLMEEKFVLMSTSPVMMAATPFKTCHSAARGSGCSYNSREQAGKSVGAQCFIHTGSAPCS